MVEKLLFGLFALIIVVTSIGVIKTNNPVRSALMLVVNFFTLAMIYITLQAHFLGVVQVIVYTGAIMVLFLFVIMLLNLGSPEAAKEPVEVKRWAALAMGLGMFALLGAQVFSAIQGPPAGPMQAPGTIKNIGNALFSHWALPFELTSVLLLVGIVGSILLAKRRL
ncbi:MAG: NADH-quinone oxidoreductase subunit J [Armatimonadetes bacterium]|nr:NADH-quinone oxidoreductase subunit J [Armatimonadota bacterium]